MFYYVNVGIKMSFTISIRTIHLEPLYNLSFQTRESKNKYCVTAMRNQLIKRIIQFKQLLIHMQGAFYHIF